MQKFHEIFCTKEKEGFIIAFPNGNFINKKPFIFLITKSGGSYDE